MLLFCFLFLRTAVVLAQGRCWIEGDNAPMSGDSKSAFGPVRIHRTHSTHAPACVGCLQRQFSASHATWLSQQKCSVSAMYALWRLQAPHGIALLALQPLSNASKLVAFAFTLLRFCPCCCCCRCTWDCLRAALRTLYGRQHAWAGLQCRSSQHACCRLTGGTCDGSHTTTHFTHTLRWVGTALGCAF
jgi:hypothetical protein